MAQLAPDNATLVANIDPARIEASRPSAPEIGDVVRLDQGSKDENGMPMSLVYCRNADGGVR